MAIVFEGAGAGVTSETSGAHLNVPMPATVNAGDLLLIHLTHEGTTGSPTTPSGWTLLDGPRTLSPGTSRAWVYGKIADGTEDGTNVSVGNPATTNMRAARAYRFSGVRSDTIANVVGGFGFESLSQAQVNDVSVTTPEANCVAVNLVAVHDDNAMGSFTGETGGDWTEAIAEFTSAATTPDVCLQIQTATLAAAGTINGGSFTMSAIDQWGVTGFYIRPAASGQTITLNRATETNTARPLAWAPKNRLLNRASETDLARPLGRLKTVPINRAAETDVARPLTVRPLRVPINRALETNLARALTGLKTIPLSRAMETNTARALAWAPKNRLLGRVVETDTARALTVSVAVGADVLLSLRRRFRGRPYLP